MNEKDIRLDNIIKSLCPPVIYLFITMIVQVIADVILFFRQAESIENNAGFMASYKFMENIEENFNRYSYLITFISASLAVALFGFVYFKIKNEYQPDGIKKIFSNITVRNAGLTAALGIFGSLGLSRFVSMLPLDNIIGNYENTSNNLLSGSLFLQLISLGIVVPIAEELIYRGLVFTGLTKVMEPKYAIFAASLIFGMFHFNLLQGTYAFLLSLVLICVYMRYKTITAPIIIHSVANIIAVISSNFGISAYFNRSIWLYISIMTVELIVGVIIFDLIMKPENNNVEKDTKKSVK